MSEDNNNVLLIVTDDKLKAFFTVNDPQSVKRELIDQLILEKGVNHGVDQKLLDELINSPGEGTFLIATGTPPSEGRDGYVQYLFSSQVVRENEQDEKKVDFREIFNVPSVTAKTVLAIYHPAVKGENGQTVTGQVIAARKVMEPKLRSGKGATLSSDGMMVSSEINGRPCVQKKGNNIIVSVDAVYQHEGDVDIKSGNLRFSGDVIVTGNVMENMIVDVHGNLKVQGFISRANVKVKGSLQVMKVVTASRIVAGGATVSLNEVKNELREVENSINSLNTIALQLFNKLQETGKKIKFGQVVMSLLDKKFVHLGSQVRHVVELIGKQEQEPPRELREAAVVLTQISGFKALELQSLDDVQHCIAVALSYLDSLSDEFAHVSANSVSNSEIESTGDINITGQGVFNSRLNSLGAISIQGVFRGGKMYAQNGINAGEIGGSMGITTLAGTQKGRMIKARRVYNGTVLQIGSRIYKVTKDINMLRARINEHDEIVLH